MLELQMLIMPMGLVMEEAAAMEITLIVIVMEQLIILMVETLEMVKAIKTKVTIMNTKMELTNQQLAVFLVMFLSSKIHSIKHSSTMEMPVKNMDKIRYLINYSNILM